MTSNGGQGLTWSVPDGCVHVLLIHILAQVHGCMGLAHADDGLQVAHCDGHALAHCALSPELRIDLSIRDALLVSNLEVMLLEVQCMCSLSWHSCAVTVWALSSPQADP